MRRVRLLIVLSMVLTLFVMGTGVAYGYISWGWHWNSQVSVGGDTIVMTKWWVQGGDADAYSARIHVSANDAELVKAAANETVTTSDGKECVVKATYVISGPKGTVEVQLVTDDDVRSDKPTGKVGKKIKVSLNICDGDSDDDDSDDD